MMNTDDKQSAVAALAELAEAWHAFDYAEDSEHWEAANARITAALTSASVAIRDMKRRAGFAVSPGGPMVSLPWVRVGHKRRWSTKVSRPASKEWPDAS